MNSLQTSLISIHFLKDPNDFDFENAWSEEIKSIIPKEIQYLEIDNFSDSVTLNYANQLIKSEKLIILVLGKETAPLGKANSILNQTIRHPNIKLFSINEIQCIKPFMIKHKGKLINNLKEIEF